jgi:hypothetical protein
MHKAAAHKPLADAPAEPEPASPAPAPDAAPDSAPAGPRAAPPPAPPAGPPPAGPPPRAARRAGQPEKKRRKTSDIDETFRLVEAALALDAPPLLPTPRSLFRMLCGVFELEFPGRLPQRAVDEALLALDARG